jgi:putative membrane protein
MMKKFLLIAAVATASAALAPAQTNVGSIPSSMTRQDSSFLKDVVEGNMDEVKLGQLALQNATSDRVKSFGQHMIDDHTRMGDEVRGLAASKNVNVASDIGIVDKASYKMLAMKTGANFDKDYIRDMVKDHETDLAAFRKEVNTGSDPDVKAAAQKAIPTLEEHLRMAREIASELGVSVK